MGGTDDSRSSEQHDENPGDENPGDEYGERDDAQPAKGKKRRRVTTAPPEGSDPHPRAEPLRHPANENDERLKGDKPPHWG
ncbi:hypothetical protein ADILRU_1070 [Leifsonia rubra CMS 76R]|nr:hypothetical protein ADILRU_1070 [Leifsonia rubra CMS 76R]